MRRDRGGCLARDILGMHEEKLEAIATRSWKKNGAGPDGEPRPEWLATAVREACSIGVEAATNQAIQAAHDATRQCRVRALDIMETVLSTVEAGKPVQRIVENACAELRGEVRRHDLSPMVREALFALARRVAPEAMYRRPGENRSLAKRRELIKVAIGAELDAVGIGLDLERRKWPGRYDTPDVERIEPDDQYRWRLLERLDD